MIYVYFAHGFEEIEGITIVDILRRAGETVKAVGVGSKTITGAHGITIHCDSIDGEVRLDKATMFVLPGGGIGTQNLEKAKTVQAAIDYAVEKDIFLGAICAAPSILGHKGLLDGKKATIFPGMEAELGGATVVSEPVVVDGKIITGNGPAAAIPFSLQLVELLQSKSLAEEIGESLQCQNAQ